MNVGYNLWHSWNSLISSLFFLQWPWLQALIDRVTSTSILHKPMKLQQYFYNDYDVKGRYNKIQTKIFLYIRSDICHDNLDIWPRIFIQGQFNSLLTGSFFGKVKTRCGTHKFFCNLDCNNLELRWSSVQNLCLQSLFG